MLIASSRLTLLALFVAVLLAGCSSQPRAPGEISIDADVSQRVGQLLNRARDSDSPERDQYTLEAVQLLVDAEEYEWAESLRESIDPDVLIAREFVDYTLLFSRSAMERDDYFLAQRILTDPRVEQQWDSLSRDAAISLRQRRAEVFQTLGEATESVTEGIALGQLLEDPQARADNHDRIWQALMTLPEPQLRDLADDTLDEAQGWYDLAALSKGSAADLEGQLAEIEDWISQHPRHPASRELPSDLELLRELIEDQPRQVALLLPLNGDYERAGRAVRDGFLAAYYASRQEGASTPQIRVFDSNQDDVNAVYDLAIQDGAEAVIGPLRPEHLRELHLRLGLSVPTLALNYVESELDPPANLYQFSFEVEDEARQVAERAWLEGHRRALLLMPQTQRGERHVSAFRQRWEELGGTVVGQSYYADSQDYSAVVESAMLVDQSRERAQQLQQVIDSDLEFERPRRRQDVDFIFMAADSDAGQLLKPTLAYYYAGDLPVFATSEIYSASESRRVSRDLNGIRFLTLPWHFDGESAIRQAVMDHAAPSPSYIRLYAMGADAYRLYPRLPQLEQVARTRFYGLTGVLNLSSENPSKLQREQTWGQIENGRVEALPAVVSEANGD